jgi:hypothetical protein
MTIRNAFAATALIMSITIGAIWFKQGRPYPNATDQRIHYTLEFETCIGGLDEAHCKRYPLQ